jgi:hypothetical protein
MLVFSTQLCELLPSNLLYGSPPPPLPSVNKNTVYTYTVCKGRGYGFLEGRGPQTDKHLPQSPFTGKLFLDNDIWHVQSINLIFPLPFSSVRRSQTNKLAAETELIDSCL